MSVDESSLLEIKDLARRVRVNVLNMVAKANSGHPGGSLSETDILAVLYGKVMKHDPSNPDLLDRDRFILSKAHACPGLYAVLAETGYFEVKELDTFRQIDSRIQGHAHIKTPGVEMSGGSLGQGLSFGVGVSLASRLNSLPCRTFVLLGDGECDEGQIWEAAMSASHHGLDNLVAIVDRNRIQNDRWTHEVMSLEPFADKWKSFGWHSIEVDGHSIGELLSAFDKAEQTKGRPSVIIANTMKGKGVSFMENNVDFHGKAPSPDELAKALEELGE
ncbi:MAG: transketolase [SAR202 cluster bacterium]|nr:transketolase [SAR202 cluster bacterium]